MRLVPFKTVFLAPLIVALFISACYKPPYNNFEPASPLLIDETHGYYNPFNFFKNKQKLLLKKLANADIQYIEYGDTRTLIIPTDRYFDHESPRFNELCYKTLNDILMLLKSYPCSKIHIAVFTDEVLRYRQ